MRRRPESPRAAAGRRDRRVERERESRLRHRRTAGLGVEGDGRRRGGGRRGIGVYGGGVEARVVGDRARRRPSRSDGRACVAVLGRGDASPHGRAPRAAHAAAATRSRPPASPRCSGRASATRRRGRGARHRRVVVIAHRRDAQHVAARRRRRRRRRVVGVVWARPDDRSTSPSPATRRAHPRRRPAAPSRRTRRRASRAAGRRAVGHPTHATVAAPPPSPSPSPCHRHQHQRRPSTWTPRSSAASSAGANAQPCARGGRARRASLTQARRGEPSDASGDERRQALAVSSDSVCDDKADGRRRPRAPEARSRRRAPWPLRRARRSPDERLGRRRRTPCASPEIRHCPVRCVRPSGSRRGPLTTLRTSPCGGGRVAVGPRPAAPMAGRRSTSPR